MWATACVWGVGIQSFRESHTNGSISKTHASHAGNHGSLKDIKVLPDFRETFMTKKCYFILQLNKMPSPNTKKNMTYKAGKSIVTLGFCILPGARSFIRDVDT